MPRASQPMPATPSADEAPHTGASVVMLPFVRTYPSPLNPRVTFPEDELAEMEGSLRENGLLQPLTGRDGDDGKVEIYIGGRRWRALDRLAKTGNWPGNLPNGLVAVIVRPVDDRELLRIAVAENVNRRDMHPLEEGEAFAKMIDRDPTLTPAQIADIYGKGKGGTRWVQERIRIARNLADNARDAFRAGAMTLAQARSLSRAPLDRQAVVIKTHGSGLLTMNADRIDLLVEEAYPPRSSAIFDVAEYTGPWLEAGRDGDEPRFQDITLFLGLQESAVEARIDELRAHFGWVDRVDADDKGAWWRPPYGDYKPGLKSAPAKSVGAVVLVSADYRTVKFFDEGYHRVDHPSKPDAALKSDDPVDAIGPKRRDYARRKRTEALQEAMRRDERTTLARLALALLGGASGTSIEVSTLWSDGWSVHPLVGEALDSWRKTIGRDLFIDRETGAAAMLFGRHPPYGTSVRAFTERDAEITLFRRLMAMTPALLTSFIIDLTAARLHASSSTDTFGDDQVTLTAAETLGLTPDYGWRIDAEYLDLLKGDELHALALKINAWCGLRDIALIDIKAIQAAKVATRRVMILEHVVANDVRLVPPEMNFGSSEKIQAAIRAF